MASICGDIQILNINHMNCKHQYKQYKRPALSLLRSCNAKLQSNSCMGCHTTSFTVSVMWNKKTFLECFHFCRNFIKSIARLWLLENRMLNSKWVTYGFRQGLGFLVSSINPDIFLRNKLCMCFSSMSLSFTFPLKSTYTYNVCSKEF